jgi:hypothetical protein
MTKTFFKIAWVAASVFAIGVTLHLSASAEAKTKKSAHAKGQVRATLEQLDGAANLLMVVSDGDKPGACGIAPSEARRLLMALHPVMDERLQAAIRSLSSRPAGKAIGNPKWDETCLKKCHCGLYASILEGVGEARLNPKDRALLDKMSEKARVMSREHVAVCARTSPWFCKSDLLAYLREEAKNYPDPLATPAAASAPAKESKKAPAAPSTSRHW